MSKRALLAVGAILIAGAGAHFILGNHLKLPAAGPSFYSYRIQAKGGMGPKLRIESDWQGALAMRPAGISDWEVKPFLTKAQLTVNGSNRNVLVAQVVPFFESGFIAIVGMRNFLSRIEAPDPMPLPIDPGLITILDTQLRHVAHLLFVPLPYGEAKFRAPCLLGECNYEVLSASADGYELKRTTREGVPITGYVSVKRDKHGLVRLTVIEETEPGTVGAESHTEITLSRIEGPPDFAWQAVPLRARQISPAVSQMSDAERRGVLTEQLKDVTVAALAREARAIKDPKSGAWGELFVKLKNLLWLRREALTDLAVLLKNLKPTDRLFLTSLNAIQLQGTAESQSVLRNLAIKFQNEGDLREAASLRALLAGTRNPTEETLNLFIHAAEWGNVKPHEHAYQARLLVGVLARSVGNNARGTSLLAPAIAEAEAAAREGDGSRLIAALEVLGNAGGPNTARVAKTVLETHKDPGIREGALLALRFAEGPDISDLLFSTTKGGGPDSKAAAQSLKLRCSMQPDFCSEEQQALAQN